MGITKKQALVLAVIKANPSIANNDADLIAAVWRKEGWNDNLSLEANIKRVTRSETITRARRKLHEDGYIKYSEQSDKDRTEAFNNARQIYSKQTFNWF